MNSFDSIEILSNSYVYLGCWLVCIIAAVALRAHRNPGPTLLAPLALAIVTHTGGWFNFERVFEATPFAGYCWSGLLIYMFLCVFHSRNKALALVKQNMREKTSRLEHWFEDYNLVFTPGATIPLELKENYLTWKQHQGRFFQDDYSVLNDHKKEMFWWAYLAPIDFLHSFWDIYLKELFHTLLKFEIIQLPFRMISKRHFHDVAVVLRAFAHEAKEKNREKAKKNADGAST